MSARSSGPPRGASPSADLRARVLAEVAAVPSPTRSRHRLRAALVAAAFVLATTGLFFAMGGLKPGTRPLELVLFTSGLGLLAAAAMTGVAAGRGGSMLGRPRPVLVAWSFGAAVTLFAVAIASALLFPDASADDAFAVKSTVACGVMTLVQGALPLLALLVPKRGSDPVHPAITGAALGMAAGTWTSMMAYLRCPHAHAAHCAFAHVAPVVLLTLAGALVGRAVLRTRGRSR